MRVVIHNGSREWRGNEKQTAYIARGLAARGHRVVVACDPEGALWRELERHGVPLVRERPRGDLDVVSALRFAWRLRRERADAVLLTSWKRIFWGGWAARRAGVRRLVVRLGLVRSLPESRKYQVAFRRYVDALIVNSQEVRARWLRSAPWFPAEAVHLVLNGIEVERPAGGSTLRAELGLGPEVPVIAAVGGLEQRKGFDLLLAAFARLAVPDARLVIAGSGGEEGRLRARARALGIADRVHWLGFRSDIPNILAGCDVYASSSRNEGMAVAMLEAMAAGALVVATEVSGVPEALAAQDGRPPAGWIVPPEDAEALALALRRALITARSSPEEAERRRAEARYRVEAWFGVERMVEEVEHVLFGGDAARPARRGTQPG
ncbi:MAG TPA: glycosyltransferase [Longimicrobiales bacterium]